VRKRAEIRAPLRSGRLTARSCLLVLSLVGVPAGFAAAPPTGSNAIVRSEFLYQKAPFPECHASTIAEATNCLVAAWFGGTAEKNPDVGIWLSRHDGTRWSPPVEVANGMQADGKRFPCWNPVLFQPKAGPLLLFYKVGPSPSRWWGMMMTSDDAGITWSPPRRMPEGILGPIKNHPVEFSDGTILCGSSTEHDGWRVHFEWTRDLGQTWDKTPPINDGKKFGIIQPGLLTSGDATVIALMRSTKGRVYIARSEDRGRTWTPPEPLTLPNPNSGLDAVTLRNGWQLLVYNPTTRGRTPLSVAISKDGKEWNNPVTLEDQPGEYSYPAVIQARDGLVHITYTWKRQRMKHVVLDPLRLSLSGRASGRWYVGGAVKKPGDLGWVSVCTVLRAIDMAGGFIAEADRQHVQLRRADGTVVRVNCDKAVQSPELDLELLPGDGVIVPRK
jgi:predicted neuraminidase